MKRILSISIVLALTGSVMAQTATKTFYANDDKNRDVVTFTSKAPLETIVGTTSKITGFVEVDPGNVVAGAKSHLEVDLASLKTGIDLRDTHMKTQFLQVDKYPSAVFDLTKVVKASQNTLDDQKPVDLLLEGNFTVHGVTKIVQIPVTVYYFKESETTKAKSPGDLLNVNGSFEILLSDYKIDRPQFIFLKLNESQKINVNFTASTALLPKTVNTSEGK